MVSLCPCSLFTLSVFPDIVVAPETIIVKAVLKTIDPDRQGLDFFDFLGWHLCCNIFTVKLFKMP